MPVPPGDTYETLRSRGAAGVGEDPGRPCGGDPRIPPTTVALRNYAAAPGNPYSW